MNQTKTQRIAEIFAELHQLFADAPGNVGLSFYPQTDNTIPPQLTCQGFSSNLAGTTFLRELGIGSRQKTIVDSDDSPPWHSLEGTKDGVIYSTYCAGLPPSCRRVQVTEKVPKQQTVDTGEFIEVTRFKVVCGQEQDGHVANSKAIGWDK